MPVRAKLLRLAVTLGAATFVAAACGGDDALKIPDGLLSEKAVDGTAVDHVWDYIGGNAGLEPCRIDGGLFSGATDDNAMAYRRTVEGHTEHVVLGVWDLAHRNFQLAASEAKRNLASKYCRTPQITAKLLAPTTADYLAFSAVVDQTSKRSTLRSYTSLPTPPLPDPSNNRIVMVSIERTDGTTPAPSELDALTHAQVTAAKKASAAKA